MKESLASSHARPANSSAQRQPRHWPDTRFRRAALLALVVTSPVFGTQALLADSSHAHHPPELYQTTSPEFQRRDGLTVRDGLVILEGDMIVGTEAELALRGKPGLRGFAHDRALARWPNGIIPYSLDAAVSADQRESIEAAIQHYHDRTRISFVEATAEDGYDTRLVFRASGGCASYVGRTDFEEQDLFIENCTVGSIIHELGHAIGLYHEHTRRDRDSFINVNWNEVVSGKERNFEILTANAQHIGEYDYGSIMHYGEFFFSRGTEATIQAPDGVRIGQREALSLRDISAIDLMYATDLGVTVNESAQTLQLADGSLIDGLNIDVAVTNHGVLGAHSLQLIMQLSDSTEWLSISQDSDWACTISGALLTCKRDTLHGESTSQFSLTANPGGDLSQTPRATLQSRTLDTEQSNNVYNGGSIQVTAATVAAANNEQAQSDDEASREVSNTDSVAQAAPTAEPTLGAATTTSAGASGPLMLLLSAGLLYGRRRMTGQAPPS